MATDFRRLDPPLSFGSKAGTLARVRPFLTTARVPPMAVMRAGEWPRMKDGYAEVLQAQIGPPPWIVRSSRHDEDTEAASKAGAYLTLAGVDHRSLEAAIEQVIATYGEPNPADEVLVQPEIRGVIRAGVAFSHDPNTCAPYRVITWSEGDDTNRVTSGRGGRTWQGVASAAVLPPAPLTGVLALVEELLALYDGAPLDCEFAVTVEDGRDVVWLFQVRPLVMARPAEPPAVHHERLTIVAEKVARGMRLQPFLLGKRSVYGVMPDWNPAEIIGLRPKPLALSLYRELVTDSIWAYQRGNYGYQNLRSFPLMPHFFGLPYVDVRVSFNSFIPADLDAGLAGRLVDYYIDRLLAEPALHDKVEFEIVLSCYTFDLSRRLEALRAAGFTEVECATLGDSLRRLTNRIVHPRDGIWRSDAARLETLRQRRERLLASDADEIERIYWLLEDGRRHGTLPFAGLARAGFVAVQMLQSMVAVGLMTDADYEAFMAGVSTVSGQLAHDRTTLGREAFLARYGHLRPGTYDILSPRYDEAPDTYFDWSQPVDAPKAPRPFSVRLPQMHAIASQLERHGLDPDVVGLFQFLQAGIELRELAKFEFSRNLSDMLSLAAGVGQRWGISREEMAFVDVTVFKELHVAAGRPTDLLRRSIEAGQARYQEALTIALPPVIVSPDDVWAFEWPETSPNFITQGAVTAPVADASDRSTLAGAIVCIPSADPGFDWLFSYPIAGLITAWGGANSHMAIRAGEAGIPAVIGAGTVLYGRWSRAHRLHVDCANRRVEVL